MDTLFFVALHSCGLTHRELFLVEKSGLSQADQISAIALEKAWINPEKAQKVASKMLQFSLERLKKNIADKQIDIVFSSQDTYPAALKEMGSFPFLLYVRGSLPSPSMPLLASVGSRKHSSSAKSNLSLLLHPLIAQGWGIVSGWAYGIDTLSHEIALAQGGYTAVVFGAGIDVMYPASNRSLFERVVASGGALISHFPLATRPERYYFPQRNALIAGLTRGTLIAEAGIDSGTLITARFALDLGRDTFAVPGNIQDPAFAGSNKLLSQGAAKIVLCAQDILDEYSLLPVQNSQLSMLPQEMPTFEDDSEKEVYDFLCKGAKDITALSQNFCMEITEILSVLTMLELRGLIRQHESGVYMVME